LKNIQVIGEGIWLIIFFLQLEQYMLFMTINDLCSLAFEGAELNPFLHTPNKRQRLLEGNGTVVVTRHIHSNV